MQAYVVQSAIPFEPVWWPELFLRRQQVKEIAGLHYERLDERGKRSLDRSLLELLHWTAGLVLQLEFNIYRELETSLSRQRGCYWEFCLGGRDFLKPYVEVERLINLVGARWVASLCEVLDRAATDFPNRAILSISPHLSDRHNGGRTVAKVTFTNGESWAYKPRNLELELGLYTILESYGLKVPKVVAREHYGWVNWIDASACSNLSEVETFYRRAGTLMAISYFLGGTDLHQENIVADGSSPIPVDLESFFQSKTIDDFNVGSTGLLPDWYSMGANGLTIGGISGIGDSSYTKESWEWEEVNTDRMKANYRRTSRNLTRNHCPRIGATFFEPREFVSQIESGFTEGFRRVSENPPALDRFRRLRARHVPRLSYDYAQAIAASLHPSRLLSYKNDRREVLSALSVLPDLDLRERELEIESLEQLDIPYYTREVDIDSVQLRIARANEKTLDQNLARIRSSYRVYRRTICSHDINLPQEAKSIADFIRGDLDSVPDTNLYEGRMGIEVFLAALQKLSSETKDRKVLEFLPPPVDTVGLGKGAGAALYGLSLLTQLTGEESYLSQAREVFRSIQSIDVSQIRPFDVIDGLAGMALSLIKYEQISGDSKALGVASACGESLYTNRFNRSSLELTSGFSHGSLGIAYTFLRLFEASKELCWLDYMQGELSRIEFSKLGVGWCHGSAGANLFLMEHKRVLSYPPSGWVFSLSSPNAQSEPTVDNLCCGSLGTSEALLIAGLQDGNADFTSSARKQVADCLVRSNDGHGFRNNGLFQGWSGLGYQCLRMMEPKLIPSVLLFH